MMTENETKQKVLHMVSLSSTILKGSCERKFHHQAELHHLCMREVVCGKDIYELLDSG